MDSEEKYRLSFTGASLMLPEMAALAHAFLTQKDQAIDKAAIIKGQKAKTINVQFRELRLRVEALTTKQMEILASSDTASQRHIALLSVCKAYSFIREFVVEVLREKVQGFDYQLSEGDYIAFSRRKSLDHPELENLTEKSAIKIKQVTLKILEQTGLIDNIKSKRISPQLIDRAVVRAIAEDNADWLKIFLISDRELDASNSIA
ncbi:DUF1819 family protein [Hymenobacter bucti]